MKLLFNKITLLMTAMICLVSCSDSDNFSTDPNLRIEFPTRLIVFDTVFTNVVSPMQEFYIFNRNKHSISFESIELTNPEESGFRINVNGQAGTAFYKEDLLKKDSLYIIVDIKASKTKEQNSLIEDKIKFTWNGNTEYINLQARAIDVEIWDNKTIDKDLLLTANKNYYIKGEIVVKEGATLNIEKGTSLYFDKNGSLTNNGCIVAQGTTDQPITFRGHRFDFIETGIPYDNASDQWLGITIGTNSFDNSFKNVRIKNAKHGLNFLESTTEKKKASLINTIIHNTSEEGVRAVNCHIDFINSQITNSKGALVNLIGGNYLFLHCTIANYYEWHPRLIASVILNEAQNQNSKALKAEFINSIIVGSFTDELNEYYNKQISSATFTNCVIQSSKERETSNFINIEWNIAQAFLFKDINNEGNYNYSFELPDVSSAKDKANMHYADYAPYDLRGISRLTDGKPDIGCYEWNY